MTFNAANEAGAVTREVVNRDHEGKPARVVVVSRRYDTDIEDAWDALTSAERLPRWFLPISGDLRLGGRYQLEGNAGGTITECEPPHRLALTWEYGGQISWVVVRLGADGDEATRFELEHIAHVDAEFTKFWDQFGPGAVGVGWDLGLMGLAEHLVNGAAIERRESDAWLAGDEGKAFVAASSRGWCEASIASGTDPAAAREAADRTTHFYTGGGHDEGGGTG